MTFEEKEDALEALIQKTAALHGMEFIWDSAEGHDLEMDDIYLEDVSGWLFPKGTPKRSQRAQRFEAFTTWRLVEGKPVIDFHLFDKNWIVREVLKGD